jgi:hypothetical protein
MTSHPSQESEPRTAAGKRVSALHSEQKSWPSQWVDMDAQADGYLHYCGQCLGRTYPCKTLRAAAADIAEVREQAAAEARRELLAALRTGVEGLRVREPWDDEAQFDVSVHEHIDGDCGFRAVVLHLIEEQP